MKPLRSYLPKFDILPTVDALSPPNNLPNRPFCNDLSSSNMFNCTILLCFKHHFSPSILHLSSYSVPTQMPPSLVPSQRFSHHRCPKDSTKHLQLSQPWAVQPEYCITMVIQQRFPMSSQLCYLTFSMMRRSLLILALPSCILTQHPRPDVRLFRRSMLMSRSNS